jgi:hypothetical protein
MDYAVPRACISAGISYCDIADGREFVTGIVALDEEARKAGVVLLSGASSVPALSGAVVRALCQGMDCVHSVAIAISASNRATAGPAVAAAILSQLGQPIKLLRNGRPVVAYGWQDMRYLHFVVPGLAPIRRRLVALVDVPDLALLPIRLPGGPAVTFRAGTELAGQNILLWLASWPVRWGWLKTLSPFASWLRPLQRLTARLGTDRSAMQVSLRGEVGSTRIERRWTLIAEHGDGPEIPSLAAPLLVERLLAGREQPGARDAGQALNLSDFEPSFASLSIHQARHDIVAPPTLYARVLGKRFAALPPAVRRLHDVWFEDEASGLGQVLGPTNWIGRSVARLMRFPPEGAYPVRVEFRERDDVETWTRYFGSCRFSSRLRAAKGQLVESFGPLDFHFRLDAGESGITMHIARWTFLGLPLPLFLGPRSVAREWEEGGRFNFDVPIALPVIGKIVHYKGWLEPCSAIHHSADTVASSSATAR